MPTSRTVAPLVLDGPTLTFLVVALVFLLVGAVLAAAEVLRGRRRPEGQVVTAKVVLREGSYGADFPDRRPLFTWADDAGQTHTAQSARTLTPGLWVGDEVTIRLDARDQSRATVVSASPPRRELLLLGIASALVGLFLGIVGLNEWIGGR